MAERQNALVTGAAHGLGLFIAQALHAAGYRVALSDRDGAAAERAARELDPSGDSTLGLALDVVSKTAFEQAAPQARPAARQQRLPGLCDKLGEVAPDEFRDVGGNEPREGAVGRKDLGRCVETQSWGR